MSDARRACGRKARRASRGRVRRSAARDRAVTPVVGKALEASLVVLFIAMLTTTLYGGVVPDYRTGVGAELGDRTLATAAERVERAVPPNATRVRSRHRVALPRTIRGRTYRVTAHGNRTLVLAHPNPAIGGRIRLALPASVVELRGEWQSGRTTVVAVRQTGGGLVVELEGDP